MSGVGNLSTARQIEMRNSRRFPLHLQVTLKTSTGVYRAKTINISAGGILFKTEAAFRVGSVLRLKIEIPREIVGTEHAIFVNCEGRVVRRSEDSSGWNVAVVIDEYEFNGLPNVR